MDLNVEMLFDQPQWDFSPRLVELLGSCQTARIVTGFATQTGLQVLHDAIAERPSMLKAFVVGAGTYSAFKALSALSQLGVPREAVRIHLGEAAEINRSKQLHRYRPMLHSKVMYFEMANGRAVAIVGSRNITGYALNGLNGEASVLLEGPAAHPELQKVRAHIDRCIDQSAIFNPHKIDAYAWWTAKYLKGLLAKVDTADAEIVRYNTLLILGAAFTDAPRPGEIIYFEVSDQIAAVRSVQTDIHLYLAATVYSTPREALEHIKGQDRFACRVVGVEEEQGGRELRAHWRMVDRDNPRLVRITNPDTFRPTPAKGLRQVRIAIQGRLDDLFTYYFVSDQPKWHPIYSEAPVPEHPRSSHRHYDGPAWRHVSDLEPASLSEKRPSTIDDTSPEPNEYDPDSGSFLLISRRRMRLSTDSGPVNPPR